MLSKMRGMAVSLLGEQVHREFNLNAMDGEALPMSKDECRMSPSPSSIRQALSVSFSDGAIQFMSLAAS